MNKVNNCITENCEKLRWSGHLRCYDHRFIFEEKDWGVMVLPKTGKMLYCVVCKREFDESYRFIEDCPKKSIGHNHQI